MFHARAHVLLKRHFKLLKFDQTFKMDQIELTKKLWSFIELKLHNCVVPEYLQNLLSGIGCHNIASIKNIDDNVIEKMQTYARNEMQQCIAAGADLNDYYHIYGDSPNLFRIPPKHIDLLQDIVGLVKSKEFETSYFETNKVAKRLAPSLPTQPLLKVRKLDDNHQAMMLASNENVTANLDKNENRIQVTFLDKMNPDDSGCLLELSQSMTYSQMASAVGQKINADPYEIQFYVCKKNSKPGQALRWGCNIEYYLARNNVESEKRFFYQRLPFKLTEVRKERKIEFMCVWLSIDMKERKLLSLFPKINGKFKILLDEAAKQIEFNSEEGSGQLRILEIFEHRLLPGPKNNASLTDLQRNLHSFNDTKITNRKTYRIEEIPRDEIDLSEDEFLIPVSHFYKNIYNRFGDPFFIKIKHGERFAVVKERLQKKLCVADKEWTKFKFALISLGRTDYFNDGDIVNLARFRPSPKQNVRVELPPFLGLEHVKK